MEISPKNPSEGQTVTVTVIPDRGYSLETLTVKDGRGNEVSLSMKKTGEIFTFTMPSGKVSIDASFMEDNSMLNFFMDVTARDWFYDSVLRAAENGITNGTSATTFSPDERVTREQLATFIYNYAKFRGEGFTGSWMFLLSFDDADTVSGWADEAIHWCVMKGIVTGVGRNRLTPQNTANRAEIVTMLYRYFALG